MTSLSRGTARQLTGPGRSAIAIIRIEGDLSALDGPKPLFRSVSGKFIREFAINALHFGVWGDPGEDVVACRTGEDSLEITCHGGIAAVSRVLEDVASRGFITESGRREPAEMWSVTQTPTIQSASHEATPCIKAQRRWEPSAGSRLPLSVLQLARTQRVAEILLEQASGVWDKFVAELDASPADEVARLAEKALHWAEFGRHLVEPWDVVLCGRPNVGKSSLMNAMAGFTRSIVSAQAGTTRDLVTLETAIQGWPVRITDTAGVRETMDAIESEGVQHTLAAMDEADLVVVVLDSSEPFGPEDRLLLERETRRQIVIAHKADLPVVDPDHLPPGCLKVSSVKGQGIDELLRAITGTLIPELTSSGQPIPITLDQVQWLQGLRDLR